jgi:hypothetical protein
LGNAHNLKSLSLGFFNLRQSLKEEFGEEYDVSQIATSMWNGIAQLKQLKELKVNDCGDLLTQ